MAEFEDNWVTRAMVDDTLVAYVLLSFTRPSLNLHWSVRQSRSKLSGNNKAAAEPNRDSPTTPLSWGGATSGGDGCEESSHQAKPVDASRSNKVGDQSEAASAKKIRKRRTLPELLEEERRLLIEKTDLKYELASMNLTVEKHRATNRSLKRMKLDLESRSTPEIATTPTPVSGKEVVDPLQETDQDKVLGDESPACAASASSQQQEISKQEPKFLLPDLNLPVEDVNSDVDPPEIS